MKLAIILPAEYGVFALKKKLWVPAVNIPGQNNIEADQQSRILQHATDWKLCPGLLYKLADNFGKPDPDLFAPRINRQLKRYVSWHPESEAMTVNAFSFTWNNNFFYMFPPFGRVGRVLAKVNRDKTEAVIDTRLVNSILVPGANAYDQS